MNIKTIRIIQLLQIKGIGSVFIRNVMDRFLSENEDLESNENFIKYIKTRISENSKKLNLIDVDFQEALDKANKIISESKDKGIGIISRYDIDFPIMLLKLIGNNGKDTSPLILNYKGDISMLNKKQAIAIIGTRHPTNEGITAAEYYGKFLAEHGYNIVSGLALGCDSIAHKGALSVSGMCTAILAHGLHMISPKKNEQIASDILKNGGVLLSEYFVGTSAFPSFFVERDRLQAGLSKATIVIQTGKKGGTMHAVNTTIKNNKILSVVYYKDQMVRDSEKVEGNTMLIKQGAFSLRKAEDLIDLINNDAKLNYVSLNENRLF